MISTTTTMNFTPVYYHIPKTGGTYVINCMLKGLKMLVRKNLKIIKIMQEQQLLAKLVSFNTAETPDTSEQKSIVLEFKNLTNATLKDLPVLAVFATTRGLRLRKELHSLIFNSACRPPAYEVITLREPFAREQSLYYYLTSELSSHEKSHKLFESASFEEYIANDKIRRNWVLKCLLNLPDNTIPIDEHFKEACDILSNFKIYKTKNAEEAVKDTFLNCYGLENVDSSIFKSYRHANTYKKIEFEELSEVLQFRFDCCTYWDKKIYSHFIESLNS